MTIKINKIEPEVVVIFKDGEYFGTVNEYEFNDLRIQIKKAQVEGFTVRKDGIDFPIDSDGRLLAWDFFELYSKQLEELVRP